MYALLLVIPFIVDMKTMTFLLAIKLLSIEAIEQNIE